MRLAYSVLNNLLLS